MRDTSVARIQPERRGGPLTGDDDLAARYGRRPVPPVRRRALLLVALLVALALVGAFWWWAELSQPTLRWDPGAYQVTSDSSVDVTFSVTKDPSATVICRIIAQDASGSVIGTKDVEVGAGTGTSQHNVTLETRGKAVIGTVDTCQATG